MTVEPRNDVDAESARLQSLLTTLDGVADQAVRSTALELVQAVTALHGAALADLLAIVGEAGTQPADTLLAKFTANPRISGVLLLHDLHPQDLATRARQAVEHLRPHLGVRGVRAEFVAADGGVVQISVTAAGQYSRRPAAVDLRREIMAAVLAVAPDLVDVVIDGLESASRSNEIYVDVASIPARSRVASR